jgi:AcrR family transcriptional regulator
MTAVSKINGQRKRRPRDPEATREVILEAARTLLATDGPEGLSLSEVAHLAGVNRGTAYQHFETREKLIKATTVWASDKLFRAAFGDPATLGERRIDQVDIPDLTDRMANFAMENPELCRVWLLQLLSSPDPSTDPFWREYEGSIARFAETDLAEPNVDSEVLAVTILAGTFLWPIWVNSKTSGAEDRQQLAHRFAQECLRFSMYGSLRVEHYPEIAERLSGDRP